MSLVCLKDDIFVHSLLTFTQITFFVNRQQITTNEYKVHIYKIQLIVIPRKSFIDVAELELYWQIQIFPGKNICVIQSYQC